MRNFVVGSFVGCVLAVCFLAACGGGSNPVIQAITAALGVPYDNTTSGMTAVNVQEALDETWARVDTVDTRVTTNEGDIATLQTDLGTLDGAVTTLGGDVTTLAGRVDDAETDISNTESDVTAIDGRVTTLENATVAAKDVTYNNTTSGLTATTTKAAIDELAAKTVSGSVFIRWGNKTAPTGTTLIYSGIAVGYGDGAGLVVMKGGDAGGARNEGYGVQFVATDAFSSRMPPGITENERIVAAVCYSSKPTTTIFGTHTAPTGWTVLYAGYAMGNGHHLICVDKDNFDATASNAGSEATKETTTRFLANTHDTTNYPTYKHIKACVVAKN